jgi:uncharacterized protein (DUF58 family)
VPPEAPSQAAAAAARYRLVLPSGALSGGAGEHPGLGTGASLELLDLRDYVPGDDLRHLDWRAFARTDRLQTRLYRAEVTPWVDIVLDLSASMAVTAEKARAFRVLAEALVGWSERAGGRPRLLAAGGGRLGGDAVPEPRTDDAPSLMPVVPLRPRGVRVLVSDLLRQGDPSPDLARLAAGAARLVILQLLDPWEANPTADGPVELIDCETGHRLELVLAGAAIDRYRSRLRRLAAAAERATRAAGGIFCEVLAAPAADMFRGELLRRRVIEPLP